MSETKDFFKKYCQFVDSVTSTPSKDDDVFSQGVGKISKWLNGNYSRMDTAITGLTGEAGECADLWTKLKFQGKELSEENRQKMIEELGDVCWYLASASMALGVDMDDIIRRNIEKLQARHPHGFSPEYMKKK